MVKAGAQNKNFSSGQSLIEIIIATAILIIALSAGVFIIFSSQDLLTSARLREQAVQLAKEGMDAAVTIRDRDFYELQNGDHGLIFGTSTWYFSGQQDIHDEFTREITITDLSTTTKLIKSQVTWELIPGKPQIVELDTILTKWQILSPDGESDEGGGETGGGGTPFGDWTHPQTLASFDIGEDGQGTDIAVQNKIVFLTTVASDIKKNDFHIFDASDPSNLQKIISLNTGKGNNDVSISGNYAYLAAEDDAKELIILDISNLNNATTVGTYSTPGNYDALCVFIKNDYLYLGTKNNASNKEFYIINVSDPTNPQLAGSYEIDDDVNSIFVKGDSAYLATALDNKELVILDIANPSNIQELGYYNTPGTADGKAVFSRGTTEIYLGTKNNSSGAEFYMIDSSNPSSPQLLGSFGPNGDINDLIVNYPLAFLATTLSTQEFAVINISNPSDLFIQGGYNFPQYATGVAFENNIIYVSVRSNDAIRIITSQQ